VTSGRCGGPRPSVQGSRVRAALGTEAVPSPAPTAAPPERTATTQQRSRHALLQPSAGRTAPPWGLRPQTPHEQARRGGWDPPGSPRRGLQTQEGSASLARSPSSAEARPLRSGWRSVLSPRPRVPTGESGPSVAGAPLAGSLPCVSVSACCPPHTSCRHGTCRPCSAGENAPCRSSSGKALAASTCAWPRPHGAAQERARR
jgi:hypothetical protein